MGRNSRMRKSVSPATQSASSVQRSPDGVVKGKRSPLSEANERFWSQMQLEFRKLYRRFGNISAIRNKTGERAGEWIIGGPDHGVREFKILAAECALKIGCHGGPEERVQFWLDHMNGEHIVRLKNKPTNFNEVDFLTQHSDGTKEMHLGRYKQSGVDYQSPEHQAKTGGKSGPANETALTAVPSQPTVLTVPAKPVKQPLVIIP